MPLNQGKIRSLSLLITLHQDTMVFAGAIAASLLIAAYTAISMINAVAHQVAV